MGVCAGLVANGHQIIVVMLVTLTMICRCEVDKTVSKYETLLRILSDFGIALDDFWGDDPSMAPFWPWFVACGSDTEGRSVLWMQGGRCEVKDEPAMFRTALNYFFALHADLRTLRNGITIVIDSSNSQVTIGDLDSQETSASCGVLQLSCPVGLRPFSSLVLHR